MRKLRLAWQLSFLPALGLALFAADVNAGAATASGTLCRPLGLSVLAYGTVGAQNINGGPVSCAVPMDDVALGSSVNFRVQVYDNSFTEGFSCVPSVVSESGATIKTAAAKTTPANQVGSFTLTGTVQAPWPGSVSGNVNTNMYAMQCYVPPGSVIYTVRAQ